MTPADLIKRARELCEDATPGPWSHDAEQLWACVTVGTVYGPEVATVAAQKRVQATADAALIAESRTLLPALADALESVEGLEDEFALAMTNLDHTLAERDAAIRRAEDAEARVKELEASLKNALLLAGTPTTALKIGGGR